MNHNFVLAMTSIKVPFRLADSSSDGVLFCDHRETSTVQLLPSDQRSISKSESAKWSAGGPAA